MVLYIIYSRKTDKICVVYFHYLNYFEYDKIVSVLLELTYHKLPGDGVSEVFQQIVLNESV